jgi:hypothetical protein
VPIIIVQAFEKVSRELLSWPGVTSCPHRFGGTEFRVNNREMGHMHGSSWADLPFPMNERNQLVQSGRAQPHHVIPDSGWVTFYIRSEQDAEVLLELFRMQYKRLNKKEGYSSPSSSDSSSSSSSKSSSKSSSSDMPPIRQ